MLTRTRPRPTGHRGWAALAPLVIIASIFGLLPAAPALAAPALAVTLEPVHYLTGAPISTASYGTNGDHVAYRVNFSCTGEPCTNVTVRMAASQPDPYGLADDATLAVGETLMIYESWTPPPAGGTVTGDDATGKVFHLGNLPAGTSQSFLVVYSIPPSGTYTTLRPAQFYPSGFQIQNSATIAAANGAGPVTSNAAPVTWNIQTPDPAIVKSNPGTIRPGVDVAYTLRMGSGAMPRRDSQAITGTSQWIAAGDYVVVDHLPPQAEFVATNGGGVYDPLAHTVTWSNGTLASPSYTAGGGWGSTSGSGWTNRGGYGARTVVLNYPADNFPEADASGCGFEVNVTNTIDVTLHYLDTARTEKSTSATVTHPVACHAPFGRSTIEKDVLRDTASGGLDAIMVPPDVTGMTCPASGTDQWGRACTPGNALAPFGDNLKYWVVAARNAGNVAGRATIVDNTLDQAGMPVYQIRANATTPAPTIEWTYRCGSDTPVTGSTTGTSVTLTAAQQSSGCRYTAATITSGDIAPGNIRASDTGAGTPWSVFFDFRVTTSSPVNVTRTNTTSGTMRYPDYPAIADIPLAPINKQARLIPRPLADAARPTFSASFPVAPVVQGGGNAVPGSNVTFSVNGASGNIPADVDITPQYVFIAPVGWTIVNGSAAFGAGSVPAGVTFTYATKTIGGQSRDVVVATWPNTTVFGENATWPTMTVVARPTFAVAAGSTSTATAWMADSRNNYDNTVGRYIGPVQDAPDVDGDANVEEWFATGTQSIVVSSAAGLGVTKEICRPNPDAADGCDWFSDPNALVPVSTTASNITYRVTLRNTGNTTLSGVIAYDVLPHVGDMGTSQGTATVPRGSTFGETVATTSNVSANLALAFSDSTNPCRPQVYPSAPGCVNNWGALAATSKAIRATVSGTLAPGATASFTYGAAVAAGSTADAKACNSVAVDSATTLPSEPLPVCATTQEADLEITVPDRLPLQTGRPGIVPFTVTNHGGSLQAPASVAVSIPAGLTVLDLAPAGWSCSATPAGTAPIIGPTELTCAAVDAGGAPRPLALEAPDPLSIEAMPTSGTSICVPGIVSGQFHDPQLDNNDAESCLSIAPAASPLTVDKDDAQTLVAPGQRYSYTVQIATHLTSEAITGITLTDALPANLRFVGAANGGTVAGQNPDGSGGTVTWTIPALQPTGVPNSTGSGTTGGTVTTFTTTVEVEVVAGSTGTVTNLATVSAPDPSIPSVTLTATDDDVDTIQDSTLTLTKTAAPAAVATVGQPITYTFTVTNDGNVPMTGVEVEDPMFAAGGITCTPAAPFNLAVDQTVTCTATYAAQASDFVTGSIVNTAIASGQPTIGPRVDSATATATVIAPAAPSIGLVKRSLDANFDEAGDVIEYEFDVTNTGNVPVDTITVAEHLAGSTPVACPPGTLVPGQLVTCTATYTTTAADVDAGQLVNHATATGLTPNDAPVTSAVASITIPALRDPVITLEKTAQETLFSAVGTTINYRFVVANEGNVTLTGVTVTDPLVGLSPISCPATTLQADATMTCTATYQTTQANLNANGVTNTATVTGTTPSGTTPTTVSDTDAHTVPADQRPAIAIEKSVSPNQVLVANEDLTYTFVVTNTGNVELTGVEVLDEFEGLSALQCTPAAPATLPAGERMTCTATYRVSQDDIDTEDQLINEATAVGTPPDDPQITSKPDSAPVPPVLAPSLTIVKSSESGPITGPGQTLEFDFVVTNTGNMTLFGLQINDPLPGISTIDCDADILAPGGDAECTATYTTTQADVDNGGVTNTATATAYRASGGAVTSLPDDVVVPADREHAVTFIKDAEQADYDAAGDVINYVFVITNTGNVTLSGLTVTDPMPGLSAVSCPATILTPAGGVMRCTATYTVTQADVDRGTIENTAQLAARSPLGDLPVPPDSETLTAVQRPELTVTKQAAEPNFDEDGDVLHYAITVTNSGNVTIEDIEITDDLPGVVLDCSQALTTLAPAQPTSCTATYTTTQADVDDGQVVNTATATGTDPDDVEISDDGTETVEALRSPSITLIKDADLPTREYDAAGQVVTFSFTATNTGNVTIEELELIDDYPGVSTPECDVSELAPEEVMTCTASYTITQTNVDDGSLLNTAEVSGTTRYAVPVEDAADLQLFAVQAPGIALTKAVLEPTYDAAGDVLHYEFTVTNTGNVTLTGVQIDDSLPELSAVDCGVAPVLVPGGEPVVCTATYTVTQTDVDNGVVTNTATATATDPTDAEWTSDPSEAESRAVQGPNIALVKAAQETSFDSAGDVIHYTFTVTNTGNVTLDDVTVTDPLEGLSPIECPVTHLAPSEQMVCTATYTTTQADVDEGGVTNTATAVGYGPEAQEGPAVFALAAVVVSDDSSVTVPAVQTPGVTLVKSVEETSFSAGTTLHFRFTVTNTGNVTIEDLAVNDPMPGLSAIECPTTTLAPGESTVCTATYVATQADVTAGRIVNTATATGSTLNAAGLVSEPSTVEVAAVVPPPPPPPTTPPPTTPVVPGELPATGGGDLPRTIGLAAALLLAGLAIVELARRRRRTA